MSLPASVLRLSMVALFSVLGLHSASAQDPLSSWTESAAKSRIISFVEDVTNPSSPNFVPAAARIATFDNDGTLWTEQPFYFQALFAVDRVKTMAADHPEWFLGVAPDASIVSVKVGDGSGNTDLADVITGIDWVIDHAAELGLEVGKVVAVNHPVTIRIAGNALVKADLAVGGADEHIRKPVAGPITHKRPRPRPDRSSRHA